MSYTIIYEPDYSRLLPAILKDCRATIPTMANQIGSVIKAYTDSQVALIGSNSIFYKLESELGVIAAVFSIDVNTQNKTSDLVINLIRPAFQEDSSNISIIINNFIMQNEWYSDILF